MSDYDPHQCGCPILSSRCWNAQLPADAADQTQFHLAVARHRCRVRCPRIYPDIVARTMPKDRTTLFPEMIFKIPALHATLCRTRLGRFVSWRRAAASSRIASRAFSNASPTVSACVHKPGSSGEETTKPPSSDASSVSTSFPSLTVYFLAILVPKQNRVQVFSIILPFNRPGVLHCPACVAIVTLAQSGGCVNYMSWLFHPWPGNPRPRAC
jgi:hypothetical protein